MIIYISGPYSGDIDINIAAAREASQQVWETGNVALCPHLNTAHFEIDCSCGYDDYMRGDLALLARCDAIYMLPGWEESRGACLEREYALLHDIPVYHQIPTGPHPVELMYEDDTESLAMFV